MHFIRKERFWCLRLRLSRAYPPPKSYRSAARSLENPTIQADRGLDMEETFADQNGVSSDPDRANRSIAQVG